MALLALCCSASTQAAALWADAGELAQLSLDDLLRVEVQSATRYAQPLADSPASVTVIDEDELRDHSYRNLAEALSTVRGSTSATTATTATLAYVASTAPVTTTPVSCC